MNNLLEHTSISNKGVILYKTLAITSASCNDTIIENIKSDLTIKPFVCPGYGNEDDITPYKIYLENTDKLYMPYYYAIAKFGGIPPKSKIPSPEPITITFSSERQMRPYQIDIIATYMASATKIGGGIISVGCGRGKTVMALKILEELKVKTLILVHKEFLMNQWVDRIKEYLPTARVGYIQGKMLDIRDKDIVLAMVQSLSDPRKDRDYPPEIFNGFGLIIADECHHMAARQFCRALGKYTFKYTLGLSATPNRADGLSQVFKWYLGEIVYKDAEIKKSAEDIALDHIPNASVKIYRYSNTDYTYCKEMLNYKKKADIVKMKGNIAKCERRTRFIISFIPGLIAEGRTILILSSLRNHIAQMLQWITNMAIPECTIGLYIGGMKQRDLDESAKCRVIIATFNMAEEAFDCKTLNTLIYATPHKNIEQAVGRILREEKQKRAFIPLVIDVQDMFSSFKNWNRIREKYYNGVGKEYPSEYFDVDDTKNNATANGNTNAIIKVSSVGGIGRIGGIGNKKKNAKNAKNAKKTSDNCNDKDSGQDNGKDNDEIDDEINDEIDEEIEEIEYDLD